MSELQRIILFSVISLCLSTIFVKVTIVLARIFNWYDEVDPRKVHQGAIPRLGGAGLFLAFGISTLIYKLTGAGFDTSVLPFFICGGIIWLSGILDDFCNLRARIKFVIQCVTILICVILSPFYLERIFFIELPVWFGKFLTFGWIIFLVNAYNLIDGIDWLCSSICLIAIGALAYLFVLNSIPAGVLFILCAAIAGFMVWNKPQAKIFLGDGGSQTLGFCVAVIPLFMQTDSGIENKFIVMLLLALIPATDVLAAIWRRLRDHRSIFSTDRSHIHHKLLNIGFSKITALIYLAGLQLLIGISIVCSNYMSKKSATVLLVLTFVFVEIFFISIHYINRAVNLNYKGALSENAQEEH